MYFSRERKVTALTLALILGLLPILGAQPASVGLGIQDLLPGSRDLHLPESSTSKATVGTLTGDGDYFMSTIDWGSIENLNSNIIVAGVDEWGLALGFGHKGEKLYVGASYSGSLIDEFYRRITNKEVGGLWKTSRKVDSSTPTYGTSLVDQTDVTPYGETINNNDVNLILGAGIFGVRVGFAQWIRSVNGYSAGPYWGMEDSLESSLKPSLELGFNIPVGSVRIKPSLRAAFDIHEFQSQKGYLDTDDPALGLPLSTNYWVLRTDRINFWEPSAGLTLALEFALSDSASLEFALEGDGALRMYRGKDDPDPISSEWFYDDVTGGFPNFPLNSSNPPYSTATTSNIGTVTIPMDLRATGAPSFAFTGDLGERLTLGAKLAVDGGFGLLSWENDTTGEESTILSISVAPDFALGASLHLIPDHFSLHAGIGVTLFTYEHITINGETTTTGVKWDEITETKMGVPSARFAGGLTVNLTQALAVDLMAISSGLDLDTTKYTLLLTVKK
ncbi:MAG: hypothetical protein LBQ46_12585 [Treponema sp.]|nr:hypothetical protein [Treponema sp.]